MDIIKKVAKQFEILDHAPIGQFIFCRDFTVIFWNRCLESWSGILREKIVGTNLLNHFPHLDNKKYAGRIKSIFQSGPPFVFSSQLHKYFIPSPLPGGEFRVQSTFVTSLPAQEDGEIYALCTMQDETSITTALKSNKVALKQLKEEIEVRKNVEEQLVRQARYDILTGLANRALLREVLIRALAKIRRNKKTFALFFS